MLPTAEEEKEEEEEGTGVENWFSSLLLDIAGQIPYSHPSQGKLVEVIRFLSRTDRLNKLVYLNGCGYHEPMQNFSMEMFGRSGTSWETDKEQQRLNINMTAFIARLISTGLYQNLAIPLWHI
ncbi:hypothetical protein BJX99DRAFT_256102 [Aspergillus californicus]